MAEAMQHDISSAGSHTHNVIANHLHTAGTLTTDSQGSAAQENRPQYYALAFIMKTAD